MGYIVNKFKQVGGGRVEQPACGGVGCGGEDPQVNNFEPVHLWSYGDLPFLWTDRKTAKIENITLPHSVAGDNKRQKEGCAARDLLLIKTIDNKNAFQ